MNLRRFVKRAWDWLQPVRTFLQSWAAETRQPTLPHGVKVDDRESSTGVPVQVATISTGAAPTPAALSTDTQTLDLLAASRQRQLEFVRRATAELVSELSHNGAAAAVVLAESIQPGAPAVLGSGPMDRPSAPSRPGSTASHPRPPCGPGHFTGGR